MGRTLSKVAKGSDLALDLRVCRIETGPNRIEVAIVGPKVTVFNWPLNTKRLLVCKHRVEIVRHGGELHLILVCEAVHGEVISDEAHCLTRCVVVGLGEVITPHDKDVFCAIGFDLLFKVFKPLLDFNQAVWLSSARFKVIISSDKLRWVVVIIEHVGQDPITSLLIVTWDDEFGLPEELKLFCRFSLREILSSNPREYHRF